MLLRQSGVQWRSEQKTMRFSPQFLDEIKARLTVSDVVRKRVELKKAGREWKGLSPFTAEKTPSFHVNDAKMAWFDFSSGQNGNIFDFVMKTEGLNFPEAVTRLANEAGVPLPIETPEAREREQKRAGLQDVLNLATDFFEDQLQTRAGARARGYLADRGLTPALQQEFRIGYAPASRSALREYLATKNASVATMCEAGLLNHGDDIPVAYDKFRDRVMFPICDASGHVIAFGGRALDKDVPAKYLNSPETPLFHKGSILYNHHKARMGAMDQGTVIAVEGYVDVISMAAVGFPNTVASCGTALTPDQINVLWRMADEPVLCFDGDRAGRKAAWRAIDTALPMIGAGRSIRFAFLPEGQDPDDLARSGGHGAINGILNAAKPLVEVLLQREMETGPLDTPERRAGLEQRLNKVLQAIPDETLRRYYREDIFARLGVIVRGPGRQKGAYQNSNVSGYRPGYQQNRQQGRPIGSMGTRFRPGTPQTGFLGIKTIASPGLTRTTAFALNTNALPAREAQILLTLINHPVLLDRYVEHLAELDIPNREGDAMRQALLEAAHEDFSNSQALRNTLASSGHSECLARLDSFTAIATLWCVRAEGAEEDAETSLKQCLALHRRARALHKELISAEFTLGQDASEENFARLREIKLELAALDGREAAMDGFGLMSGRQPRNL
jgi:DNA primase